MFGGKKWVTLVSLFFQAEHNNDIDFIEISQDVAEKILNGVSFDKELKTYLSFIDKSKSSGIMLPLIRITFSI